MTLKQIDDIAMEAANLIEKLQARNAKLEAENAELKKTNLKQGFHIAELQGELDLARMNTREQIAGLVKGLEWREDQTVESSPDYRVYYSHSHRKCFFVFYGKANPLYSDSFDDIESARAAAERHHRETILSLLNL